MIKQSHPSSSPHPGSKEGKLELKFQPLDHMVGFPLGLEAFLWSHISNINSGVVEKACYENTKHILGIPLAVQIRDLVLSLLGPGFTSWLGN